MRNDILKRMVAAGLMAVMGFSSLFGAETVPLVVERTKLGDLRRTDMVVTYVAGETTIDTGAVTGIVAKYDADTIAPRETNTVNDLMAIYDRDVIFPRETNIVVSVNSNIENVAYHLNLTDIDVANLYASNHVMGVYVAGIDKDLAATKVIVSNNSARIPERATYDVYKTLSQYPPSLRFTIGDGCGFGVLCVDGQYHDSRAVANKEYEAIYSVSNLYGHVFTTNYLYQIYGHGVYWSSGFTFSSENADLSIEDVCWGRGFPPCYGRTALVRELVYDLMIMDPTLWRNDTAAEGHSFDFLDFQGAKSAIDGSIYYTKGAHDSIAQLRHDYENGPVAGTPLSKSSTTITRDCTITMDPDTVSRFVLTGYVSNVRLTFTAAERRDRHAVYKALFRSFNTVRIVVSAPYLCTYVGVNPIVLSPGYYIITLEQMSNAEATGFPEYSASVQQLDFQGRPPNFTSSNSTLVGTVDGRISADVDNFAGASRKMIKANKPVRLGAFLWEMGTEGENFDEATNRLAHVYPRYGGGCSGVCSGKYHGRNFDWNYDDGASIVIRSPARDGKHAVIGISDGAITDSFLESGAWTNAFYSIPFCINDGMNDSGVVIQQNVIPRRDAKSLLWRRGRSDAIIAFCMVRYALDRCSTAREAADLIRDKLFVPSEFPYDLHYQVSDKENTFIVEDGVVVSNTVPTDVMTNFRINGTDYYSDGRVMWGSVEPYGIGVERYDHVRTNGYNNSTLDGMAATMQSLWYTQAYDSARSPYWYTEHCDSSTPELTVMAAKTNHVVFSVQKAQWYTDFTNEHNKASADYRGGSTWQTVHTSIYDKDELSLRLYTQEDPESVRVFYIKDDRPLDEFATKQWVEDKGYATVGYVDAHTPGDYANVSNAAVSAKAELDAKSGAWDAKQDALPYPTNAIPAAVITNAPWVTQLIEKDPTVGLTNNTVYASGTNSTFLTSYTESDPVWGTVSNSFENALKEYADRYANQAPDYNAVSNRAMLAMTNHQSLAGYATEDLVKNATNDAVKSAKDYTNLYTNQAPDYISVSSKALNSVQTDDIVDNVITTNAGKVLSANMGKELNDRIDSISARGRYLSVWDCETGLPQTEPTVSNYLYHTGDYYIVGKISSLTNYCPFGSNYVIGVASTNIEANAVNANDTYCYDGTRWTLIHASQKSVLFSEIVGDPSENTELNAKFISINAAISGRATTAYVDNAAENTVVSLWGDDSKRVDAEGNIYQRTGYAGGKWIHRNNGVTNEFTYTGVSGDFVYRWDATNGEYIQYRATVPRVDMNGSYAFNTSSKNVNPTRGGNIVVPDYRTNEYTFVAQGSEFSDRFLKASEYVHDLPISMTSVSGTVCHVEWSDPAAQDNEDLPSIVARTGTGTAKAWFGLDFKHKSLVLGGAKAYGEFAMAVGESSNAGAKSSFALGYYSHAVNDYAFAWNGVTEGYNSRTNYESRGVGTFSVNPVGGTSGFYVGTNTLASIIAEAVSNEIKRICKDLNANTSSVGQVIRTLKGEN